MFGAIVCLSTSFGCCFAYRIFTIGTEIISTSMEIPLAILWKTPETKISHPVKAFDFNVPTSPLPICGN
jgi:hypothetical protein